MTADQPESLRDGRYAIIGLLAEGSQGATFDAVDKQNGRPVAIKRFLVKGARSWKDVELAEREAQVLSRLSHPKLPAHVEHFEEDGALYLVMEKIEGESLQILRERRPLSRDEVVRFLHDLAEVLEYLHRCDPPVIHRDIKPGNVIRRPDGSHGVVDFGSVRDRLKLKGGSTVVGTFGYMAPEQFQGRALPASDVYSVGATALTLLTGVEPEDLPHQGLAIDVDAALQGRVRVDRSLSDALKAMLVPNPDQRASRLGSLLAHLPRPAAPRQGEARAEEPAPRRGAAPAAAPGATSTPPSPPAPPAGEAEAQRSQRSGPIVLPPLVALAVVFGLTVARVGVSLSLRVVVPVVLALLSLIFGRALLKASKEVAGAGRRAGQALGRAQRRVRGKDGDSRAAGRGRRRRGRGLRGRRRRGVVGSAPEPEQSDARQGASRGSSSRRRRDRADARARSDEAPTPGPRIDAPPAGRRIDPDAGQGDSEQGELREALQEIEDAVAEIDDELNVRKR